METHTKDIPPTSSYYVEPTSFEHDNCVHIKQTLEEQIILFLETINFDMNMARNTSFCTHVKLYVVDKLQR